MPWEYVEDSVTSDVTIRVRGRDLDDLFTAAAEAVSETMVEHSVATVEPRVRIPVTLAAPALDLLLMRFLEELVFHKDAQGLILLAAGVRVRALEQGEPTVTAELRGEVIDPARHARAADVKAVTLYGLRVAREDGGWRADVTLDV